MKNWIRHWKQRELFREFIIPRLLLVEAADVTKQRNSLPKNTREAILEKSGRFHKSKYIFSNYCDTKKAVQFCLHHVASANSQRTSL